MKPLLPGYRAALQDAPPWIRPAAEAYAKLSRREKLQLPFLYFVLGGRQGKSTPDFKMAKPEAYYLPISPIPGFSCANCPYSYEVVTERGRFICSQVRGSIRPQGWCAIPHFHKDVWRPLTKREARRVRSLTALAYMRRIPQVPSVVDPRTSRKTPMHAGKQTVYYP